MVQRLVRPKVPTWAARDSMTASHAGAASDSLPASHGGAASQRIEPLRVRIQMQERLDVLHARCTVHVMVVQIHVPRTHPRQRRDRLRFWPHGGVRFWKAWMDDGGAVVVVEVRLAVESGAGGCNNTAAVHRNSIKGGAVLEG
jgi:hypothetical protein